jgi:probable rRNA maturation factor
MRSLYLGPWRIDVEWRDDVPRLLPATALARAAVAALDAAGAPRPASLGLILADDAELAELNATHMGKAGPTDVLSFPLLPPEAYPPHPGKVGGGDGEAGQPDFPLPPGARPHLGDIVVSVERAIDQAAAGRGGQTGDVRWDARDELRLLVTHGTLHVCGWDHAERDEEAAMRRLEASLLDGSRAATA